MKRIATFLMHWYTLSLSKIEHDLATNLENGLSESQVQERQQSIGFNRLPSHKPDSISLIFIRQFKSPFIAVLLFSAIILFALNSVTDAFIILFVLVFNACVGTFQEGKAQNTLAALKNFVHTNATVIRSGRETIIDDSELVPGDVILLSEGERIPADARVVKCQNLRVNESAITGETSLSDKIDTPVRNTILDLARQKNMVFKGTVAVAGSARAVVVATGTSTEIGKIGVEIGTMRQDIPLQRRIAAFGTTILLMTASISGVFFLLGMMAGTPLSEMFATVISLSVGIIPEGLPIVITLVLATGVYRMARRRAIVKKMQAVEALGEATVIAVDKTGTVTKNEMVIRNVAIGSALYSVSGNGYSPNGMIETEIGRLSAAQKRDLKTFAQRLVFAANAHVAYDEEKDSWRVAGDPSEAAMIVLGQKLGIEKEELFDACPRIGEIPFDTRTKYHAVLHRAENKSHILTVAGAPESVIPLCSFQFDGGRKKRLADEGRRLLHSQIATFAQEGKRIIALAWKEMGSGGTHALESAAITGLTLSGYICIEDSLRAEVPEAVQKARAAGIRIVMMTGDALLTAQAIARQAGIFHPGDALLTGADIEGQSTEELSKSLSTVTVFARMTPEHKLAIIRAFKERGDSIAMTGDGVNDAPALVAADLGIGMGKIGTDVAKEASDIILLDDNLSTIVAAIEEGRTIIKSIRRVILYLMTNNVTEVALVGMSLVAGLPLPLLPAQLIWLNLVTDTFLDAAIGMEGSHGREFRLKKARSLSLFDASMARRLLTMAIPSTIACLVLLVVLQSGDQIKAYSMIVTTIAVAQWFNAWSCRFESSSIFNVKTLISNRYLVGALFIVFLLQVFALTNPFLQNILHLQTLTLAEWLICIAAASTSLVFEEVRKLFARRGAASQQPLERTLALAPQPATVL